MNDEPRCLLALGFGLLSLFACTKDVPAPDATPAIPVAAVDEEPLPPELEPLPLPSWLPSLPAAPSVPPGLPAEIWADLHWLPPEVVGINGTAPGTPPLLARWVFSQPFADHQVCQIVQRGLSGGYGIEWEQPPQSFVFFATVDPADIATCAHVMLQGPEQSVEMDGHTLVLRAFGSEERVEFARRGDQVVVVVDDGRLGSTADAQSGRLSRNERLIALLATVESTEPSWAASARDMTGRVLGVTSRGLTLYASQDSKHMKLHFAFADQAEAQRALVAAGPVVTDAEAFLGVSLGATLARDGDVLVVSIDLTALGSLEPEKLAALNQRLQTKAALQ